MADMYIIYTLTIPILYLLLFNQNKPIMGEIHMVYNGQNDNKLLLDSGKS